MALVISAIVALGMVSWQRTFLRQSADFMQSALAAAGIIILITPAGGAVAVPLPGRIELLIAKFFSLRKRG
jgi:H+/gluconate symporter-like permease